MGIKLGVSIAGVVLAMFALGLSVGNNLGDVMPLVIACDVGVLACVLTSNLMQ